MTTIDDNITAQDVVDTAWSRYTEWFIVDVRTQRVGDRDYIMWKNRIREFDALYRGDWQTVYPDEETKIDLPRIQNLIQTGTDDLARLVSGVQPDIFCPPRSDKEKDIHAARLREAVLATYWVKGRGELLVPWLVQDLCASGIALLASVYPTTQDGEAIRGKYPYPYRLDPRGSYPDVVNGILQDVVVLQRMRRRQAENTFQVDLSSNGPKDTDDIEVIDYYCQGGMVRVMTGVMPEGPVGKPWLYSKVNYGIDCVPVAFSMNPTADGHFRGLYDQAKGPLATQNRLVTLAMEYADQAIYAPWEEYGITNNTEKPGPNTVYHKIDEKAGMARVQPAVSSPQLFEWMQLLEQSSRGVIARPSSREGEVTQSIASGDFVNATQGALTTQTRFVQGLIGDLRRQWNEIALETDDAIGGPAKPLSFPVGKDYEYDPKAVISGYRDNQVVYGAGAGLDYLNRKQAILQEVGAMLISKDTARAHMDDIVDPEGEARKIEREAIQDSLLQRVLSSGDTLTALKLLHRVGNGEDFADAAGAVAQEMQAQQQQQAQLKATQAGADMMQMQQGAGQGAATPPGTEQPPAPEQPQQPAGPEQAFRPEVPSESIMVRGA